MNIWYFLLRLRMRGNSFAHLSRVVIEGSRGVGKRVKRQDEGCWTGGGNRLGFDNHAIIVGLFQSVHV